MVYLRDSVANNAIGQSQNIKQKFEKNRTFPQRAIPSNNIFPPFPKDFSLKRTFLPTIFLQIDLFLGNLSTKPLSFKGILQLLLLYQRVFWEIVLCKSMYVLVSISPLLCI